MRGGLRETLAGLPDERLDALFFRHPIGGPLDAAGTLTFLDEHARHHDAQLRRIWSASGCPG
ncbi:MAG: DinB family protein [Thermoanaerobaculia bacterium]|nr:DinB family protein [Thermoanaerobaculia bacterium]